MSIPETTTVVDFDSALRHLAAQAATYYAGEQDRIGRGLVLALNGHVTLLDEHCTQVQSATDPEVLYNIVGGVCDCKDATTAPGLRCKHRWAYTLTKRAGKHLTAPVLQGAPAAAAESVELPVDDELPPLVPTTEQYEEAPAPVAEPTLVPLPEAAASLNIKVKAGQFEVQYTMRGMDDASVLTRLPAVVDTLERMLPAGEEEGLLLRLLHAFFPPSARMR